MKSLSSIKKQLLGLGLAVLVVLPFFTTPALAAQGVDNAQRKQTLETQYSITIKIPADQSASEVSLYLDELENALRDLTPAMVTQVSAHYRKTVGRPLSISYVYRDSPFGMEVGYFSPTTGEILLMTPQPGMVSGMNSMGYTATTITHEFGHAFYFMCQNLLGKQALETQWTALNQGLNYGSGYRGEDKVFASSYGSTNIQEDFAEVFKLLYSNYRRTVDGTSAPRDPLFGNNDTGIWAKTQYVRGLIQLYVPSPEAPLATMEKAMGDRMSARSMNLGQAGAYHSGDVTASGYCVGTDQAMLTPYTAVLVTTYADGPEPTGALAAAAAWHRERGEDVTWLSAYGVWRVGSSKIVRPGDLAPGTITFDLYNGKIGGYNKTGGMGSVFMEGIDEKKFMLDFSSNRVSSVAEFYTLSPAEQETCYQEYQEKERSRTIDPSTMTPEDWAALKW